MAQSTREPQVLIVESREGSGETLESALRAAGFVFVERCLPRHAVESVRRASHDLVLMDRDVSDPTGDRLCRDVKHAAETGFVPVIMLTPGGPDEVVRLFEWGADDCIRWPGDAAEMLARVRNMLRIKRLQDELRRLNVQFTELSTRDDLTGLFNRRYLFERLAIEVERSVRYQTPLSCIMIDMDAFKPVNDTYGHLVGDAFLRRAAEVFASLPRRVDVVARYGGDEVCIVLPATGVEASLVLAQRVRETMERKTFTAGDKNVPMTVSLGVASLDPADPVTADELVHRADVALYAAKNAHGNCVRVWRPGMPAPADLRREVGDKG